MTKRETALVTEALVAYRLLVIERSGGLRAVSGAYEADHPYAGLQIQANYLEELELDARSDALLGSSCW